MNIDIIGAGIGGLTTALALEQKGFTPTIYEQAKSLKPVGAGIILASNAMKVYRHLGLEDKIKTQGIPLKSLNVTDGNLKALSKVDLAYFKNKYNLQSVAIHRGKLQQILLDSLQHTDLFLNHELKGLSPQKEGYRMDFENGKSISSSLLLGADGLYSKVRNSINPNCEIRTTNQVCWRGVTTFNLPANYKNELNEAWGKGERFAFVEFDTPSGNPTGGNQLYWYAVKSFKQSSNEFSVDQIASYFKNYPPIIQKIIEATPLETVHTAELKDLKPIKTWHNNFACLIGDAAHATTPNMGQGACQSIEDAYVIAECLVKFKGHKAFAEYQRIRIKNAHKVVNRSWQIGKISHWKNAIAIFLRNKLLSVIPEKVNRTQLEKLFQLQK